MVETLIRDGVEHRVTVSEGYMLDPGTMSLRPVDMHPNVEELRAQEIERCKKLGVCGDILAQMGV